MTFDFIDSYKESTQQDLPPTATEAQVSELNDLVNLAQNLPCLHWEYDPSKGGPVSNGDQLGFITQSLKKIPGLESAVSVDENGVENFDSRFVAAAALSLCAALARKVLDVKLREDYAEEENITDVNRNELGPNREPTDETTTGAETTSPADNAIEQSGLESN